MNIGIESRNHQRRLSNIAKEIESYFPKAGKAKTIKHIVKKYGYSIPAAALKFKEIIEENYEKT